MILYDKDFEPLGVSQDILNFLGYEDIDDFKTYATDVADLFVKKSGYIYKYENFSWISYILHSGTPNKSAIVRLKNGKEKEINLAIKELFLFQNDEDSPYYEVDVIYNQSPKHQENEALEPIIAIEEDLSPPLASRPKKETQALKDEESFSPISQEPLSNFPQNKSQISDDSFIEDISDDNLSFIQSLELPTTKALPNKVSKSQTNELKKFTQEFLEYNDSIVLDLLNAVTQKRLKEVQKHVINLEGIAQILQLENLSESLELLKSASTRKVLKAFEDYQDTLEEIRRKIS